MIRLTSINHSIQIVLGSAKTTADMPVVVTYSDRSPTGTLSVETTQLSSSNGITATTICTAPTGDTIIRGIEHLSVYNADTASKTVTINFVNSGTSYALIKFTMSVGDTLVYGINNTWAVLDSSGNTKQTIASYAGSTSQDFNVANLYVAGASSNSAASAGQLWLRGGQIGFPATQVSSTDPNTLDDYEEGSWTPTFSLATPGTSSFTYTSQFGSYTKIGRLVHIHFRIECSASAAGTGTGQLYVSSLPFAVGSGSNYVAGGSVGHAYNFTTTWPNGVVSISGTSNLSLTATSTTGNTIYLSQANISGALQVYGTYIYCV